MMIKIVKKFRFLVLLLVFLLLILPAYSALACDPSADPWFATRLSFDQATLPSGVEIVQTDPTYEPYALINRSSEPFYVVRETQDRKTFPNSELPQNYEPQFKITSSQVYYWGPLYSQDSQDSEGWKPNWGGVNNSAATSLRIDKHIYILEGESKQIYEDNRPAVVAVPDPQNFHIRAFYKNSPVEIRGTLLYFLNEKYDPKSVAKGLEGCNKWEQSR